MSFASHLLSAFKFHIKHHQEWICPSNLIINKKEEVKWLIQKKIDQHRETLKILCFLICSNNPVVATFILKLKHTLGAWRDSHSLLLSPLLLLQQPSPPSVAVVFCTYPLKHPGISYSPTCIRISFFLRNSFPQVKTYAANKTLPPLESLSNCLWSPVFLSSAPSVVFPMTALWVSSPAAGGEHAPSRASHGAQDKWFFMYLSCGRI